MPLKTLLSLTDHIVTHISPARCQFCRAVYPSNNKLVDKGHRNSSDADNGANTSAPYSSKSACPGCLADLPRQGASCYQCALPLPADSTTRFCGECLSRQPPFTRTLAAFDYQPPITTLINRFKHHADMVSGSFLAQQLAQTIKQHYKDDDWPDVLTAVPLHWRRQLGRGFNQAAYLSRQLSQELAIPSRRTCRRRAATGKQQSLSRRRRLQNVRRSFEVITQVEHQHIALIDDVMTTGTTARELSAILLAAGARRVDIWIVARTPAPNDRHSKVMPRSQ